MFTIILFLHLINIQYSVLFFLNNVLPNYSIVHPTRKLNLPLSCTIRSLVCTVNLGTWQLAQTRSNKQSICKHHSDLVIDGQAWPPPKRISRVFRFLLKKGVRNLADRYKKVAIVVCQLILLFFNAERITF